MATTLEVFANQPSTTVTSGGTDAPASGTQESWTVASSSSFPAASSSASPPTQFHVCDTASGKTGEIIAVTSVSGTAWTVTRGAENSATIAHSAGFTVQQVVSADGFGSLLASANDLSDVASAAASRVHLGLNRNVVSIDAYGADPTGAADSTAAFNDALAALPAASNGLAYGQILGSPGTYKLNSSGAQTNPVPPGVSVEFAGKWSTMVMDYGTGDCFRLQNPVPGTGTWPSINGWGGGIKGCTIDGTHNTGAGGTGLHIVDGVGWDVDVAVQNYTGASSAGVRQHSYMWWTYASVRAIINNCTQSYLYDCSDGPSYTVTSAAYQAGSPNAATYITSNPDGWTVPGFPSVPLTAGMLMYGDQSTLLTPHTGSGSTAVSTMTVYSVTTTTNPNDTLTCHYTTGTASGTSGTLTVANSTGSHQGSELDLWIHQNATQDGLVFANGSNASNGVFRVNGAWIGQGTQPSSAVVRITGVIPAGHQGAGVGSILTSSRVSVWAEHDSGTYGPYTIWFGSLNASNTWLGNSGLLWFQGMTASNLNPVAYPGIFRHFGPVIGDANLSPGAPAGTYDIIGVSGGLLMAQAYAVNGVLHVKDGDFFDLGVLSADVTVTISQATTAPMRKTVKATQAASGGPYTITWPASASPTASSPAVLWPGGTAPVMSTAAGAVDYYMLETIDGATWSGRAVQASVPVLAIDGTASDIQPDGAQAAGSTGSPPDAGHVHPASFTTLADAGLLAACASPDTAANSDILTAGVLYLIKIPVREAITATSVAYTVITAGSGTSSGSYAGLYSSSGTLLTGSADITASLTSTGYKTSAFTAPQALTAGTFVWAAILVNLATTQPTLATIAGNHGTVVNLGLAAASLRFASQGSGQTALPASITPAGNAASNLTIWCGIT